MTCDLQLYSASSQNAWGSLLGTITSISLPGTVGWVTIDVSSLNISVTAGNYYGFKLIPYVGGYNGFYISNNDYADGQTWASDVGFDAASDFAFIVSTNITLPVSLTSFTAQKQNDHTLLQWSTASETNSKDFIVQRSHDGNNWNKIGTVAAAGNSQSTTNYNYVDNNPSAGINYYRLLQTDIDGKSSYSETRTVKFSTDSKAFSILVNPVKDGRVTPPGK